MFALVNINGPLFAIGQAGEASPALQELFARLGAALGVKPAASPAPAAAPVTPAAPPRAKLDWRTAFATATDADPAQRGVNDGVKSLAQVLEEGPKSARIAIPHMLGVPPAPLLPPAPLAAPAPAPPADVASESKYGGEPPAAPAPAPAAAPAVEMPETNMWRLLASLGVDAFAKDGQKPAPEKVG